MERRHLGGMFAAVAILACSGVAHAERTKTINCATTSASLRMACTCQTHCVRRIGSTCVEYKRYCTGCSSGVRG